MIDQVAELVRLSLKDNIVAIGLGEPVFRIELATKSLGLSLDVAEHKPAFNKKLLYANLPQVSIDFAKVDGSDIHQTVLDTLRVRVVEFIDGEILDKIIELASINEDINCNASDVLFSLHKAAVEIGNRTRRMNGNVIITNAPGVELLVEAIEASQGEYQWVYTDCGGSVLYRDGKKAYDVYSASIFDGVSYIAAATDTSRGIKHTGLIYNFNGLSIEDGRVVIERDLKVFDGREGCDYSKSSNYYQIVNVKE